MRKKVVIVDCQSTSGPGANQEILIPGASAGALYVLVYGDNVPSPGPLTLEGDGSS